MGFTVCYTYKGKRVVTKLAVDHLSPYAGVCYALLQSGAYTEAEQAQWPNSYPEILETAMALDIIDVSIHRTLKS